MGFGKPEAGLRGVRSLDGGHARDPKQELIADRIPSADGHQQALIHSAHTFNGYSFLDGADPSELFRANWSDLSLSELRCLLFLYVRADRWGGDMSTDWPLMWDLVAAIRGRVQAGELD